MDEGYWFNAEYELASKRRLTAEEIQRSRPLFQACIKANSLLDGTGQGLQPSNNNFFLSEFANEQGILNEEQQPASKKIRRIVDETIVGKNEDIVISALPDDSGMALAQCQQSRSLCPNYACPDPQLQANSFGLHCAAIADHEQFIWSQDFTLQAEQISRVCKGRRHAVCEELDNTACLVRNRRMESFNFTNISHELKMLTDSRKRKRSDTEEYWRKMSVEVKYKLHGYFNWNNCKVLYNNAIVRPWPRRTFVDQKNIHIYYTSLTGYCSAHRFSDWLKKRK